MVELGETTITSFAEHENCIKTVSNTKDEKGLIKKEGVRWCFPNYGMVKLINKIYAEDKSIAQQMKMVLEEYVKN